MGAKLLTSGQVAEILGLKSRQWVNALVEQGHLKPETTLDNGMNLFTPDEVERVRKLRERYPTRRGQLWDPPRE